MPAVRMPAVRMPAVRAAADVDWPALWTIMEPVVRAGETYCWDTCMSEEQARVEWLAPADPSMRVYVALLDDGDAPASDPPANGDPSANSDASANGDPPASDPSAEIVAKVPESGVIPTVSADASGSEVGAVVGTAQLHANRAGGGSHVANASFMVAGDLAGRGVARALAEHVLAEAREQGYHAMQFNAVVETNVRAVRLWESLGFRILTTVPAAFRHPGEGFVGLHLMHREL